MALSLTPFEPLSNVSPGLQVSIQTPPSQLALTDRGSTLIFAFLINGFFLSSGSPQLVLPPDPPDVTVLSGSGAGS